MTTLWATLLCSALSFTEQRFEVPGRVLWADGVDVDGDKRADLVVFFRRGEEPNTKRAIAWYLQKDGGSFSAQPSEVRTLADDVSFATLDDLDSDGRTEVVLLSAEAVLTFAFTDKGLAEHPTTILKATTATPFAENEDLPEWKFVDDWHQTGHKELALWKVGATNAARKQHITHESTLDLW